MSPRAKPRCVCPLAAAERTQYLIPALTTHDERSHSRFHHFYIHFMERDNSLIWMVCDHVTELDVTATNDDCRLFGSRPRALPCNCWHAS